MTGLPHWGDLVTAEQLHDASELLRAEHPEGSIEGAKQAEEIGRFIQESHFRIREEGGQLGEEISFDPQSLGYGVMLGILVTRQGEEAGDA